MKQSNDGQMQSREEDECPICEMNRKMAAIATAHMSCSAVKDDNDRGECMRWASDLDPSKIEDVEKLMIDTYRKTGLTGLGVMPKLYNELIKKVVIQEVGSKIEKHQRVSDDEMEMYKDFIKEDAKRGI